MDEAEFIGTHTRLRSDRRGLSLIDQPDGACIFLQGQECQIQSVKPEQCRGFPNAWNFPGWREVCEATEIYSVFTPISRKNGLSPFFNSSQANERGAPLFANPADPGFKNLVVSIS